MDKKALISCKFNVFLHCSTTEKTEKGVVRFETTPVNILDVKKQIEEQFSIAVCVQAVSYEGYMVKDDTLLTALRVRDGDAFSVKYLEKSHCTEINEILDWMKLTVEALQQDNLEYRIVGISSHTKALLYKGLHSDFVKDLAFEYFYPWLDPVKYANKLHFVYNGGAKKLMDLHAALICVPWEMRTLNNQLTEFYLLRAIWNFTETFPLRRAICKRDGIEMCIQSMLHYKQDGDQTFGDLTISDHAFEGILLRDTIVGGLGALCNLSELPEYHMKIASNEGALQQMADICASPYMPLECTNYVAVIFLCLAYTPDTHPLVANPIYLRKLLDAIHIEKTIDYPSNNYDTQDLKQLLRYYVLLFLAQVCLMSPQCIPESMCQEITSEMTSLLQSTSYKTVRETELKLKYLWSTYVPYVKLAYIPHAPLENNPTSAMHKLQMWSLELVIFALQNMLGRKNHREFLVKEGLLDFVLCMPQYVPPTMQLRATELVQIVTSSPDISQRPPKLLNIVKAHLAKMHFGLESVLSMSVSEIVTKVTNLY